MPSRKVIRPLLLLSLLSTMTFSLMSVHAQDTATNAVPHEQPTPAKTVEVQRYTAGKNYTLRQARTETYAQKVPDYEGLRAKALAYAQTRVQGLYAQADADWRIQVAAAKRAAKKAVKNNGDKKKISTFDIDSTMPSEKQWTCLNNLWTGESGWQVYAENAESGAYGIAQALPASKMAAQGSNWRDSYRTQIDWGLTYISSRYETPCKAWDTWQARNPHWY